jgi:arylsulfatase
MVELDDVLNQLIKALQDTGQLENTLIFILSDNGPMMEPWPDAGFTPFRGSIGCTWEGGVRVPGIVYWKDMITPGQINDGLFDFCDFLPTLLDLAGASSSIPKDRYIDGIDQTSFLLADEGLSNRKTVYYWLQDSYSGHRVAEYKVIFLGTSFDDFDVVNADAATTLETFPNAKLFNLYLDPKERYSFASRQTFMDVLFSDPYKFHKQTFIEYPPKKYVAKFAEIAELAGSK